MPEFPEPTSDQKAYVAGWSDPAEARRRRLEALAAIVVGLHPWAYTPGVVDTIRVVVEGRRDCLYCTALRRAKRQLILELGLAGALDDTVVYDECGDPVRTIQRIEEGKQPGRIARTRYVPCRSP
jgi:hypothetical protein